ncbi:MAG: long-chain-fatty-acid--CoA ligase [Ramlibacter sp.]
MKSNDVRTWPAQLPHRLDVPRTNVCYLLHVSAARFPERVAVIDAAGELRYQELLAQVERLAGWLEHEAGVREGDRVLLYLANSRSWIAAYYAILRIGAVVVPVNPMNKREELKHYIAGTEAVAAFCGAGNASELLALPEAARLRRIVVADGEGEPLAAGVASFESALQTATAAAAPMRHEPDRLALILYSSGTTAAPKGCMHTHSTLNASTVIVSHWMAMVPHSVQLVALPFFHITGMQNLLNAPLYGGGTLVLMKRWNRDEAAALIARHRVSHWTAMPTMVIDFLASPSLKEYDLSSVRRMGGGGAGMPEAVGARLKAETGLDFLEGYGLSETAHVTGNPPAAFKRQCLGVPLFDSDVRIVDPETQAELAPGEVGEIVMAGPQVFTGYWRDEAASRAAEMHIDGKRFVRSGDLGQRDEGGYFFLVDRLKRMVNASGYKVWPSEVESLLHAHPDVAEACVIAAPDAYRGETVKAVIVLREAARGRVSADDIIEWSRGQMAAYKYPRLVEFVDALPRSATGKIAWRELQERERARPPTATPQSN